MIPPEIESYLRVKTAGIKHGSRTLYHHLRGTHDLLEQDGAPEHVCLAGLFHSIYGTNVFRRQAVMLDHRMEVSDVIGKDAEWLAYVFCACNRPHVLIDAAWLSHPIVDRFSGERFSLSAQDLRDLLRIELANLTEQGSMEMVPLVQRALTHVDPEHKPA